MSAGDSGSSKSEEVWSEEKKQLWLAQNGEIPTHVVRFEPMYQILVSIPPWERPVGQLARSARAWGKSVASIFDGEQLDGSRVLAAHHEGESIEVYKRATDKPPALSRVPKPETRIVGEMATIVDIHGLRDVKWRSR